MPRPLSCQAEGNPIMPKLPLSEAIFGMQEELRERERAKML